MSKYRFAKQLFKRMTNDNSNERPNCEQILDQRYEWALFRNDLRDLKELKDLNAIESKFIQFMIESKLAITDVIPISDENFSWNY
jgi:hypothetical protein